MGLIEVAAGGINATVLLGFYFWIRGHLMRMNREVGELKSWQCAVETRCQEHNKQLGRLFDKVDDVKQAVSTNDSETAKAIGNLSGKVEMLLKKGA